jgi:hypothetical protein
LEFKGGGEPLKQDNLVGHGSEHGLRPSPNFNGFNNFKVELHLGTRLNKKIKKGTYSLK